MYFKTKGFIIEKLALKKRTNQSGTWDTQIFILEEPDNHKNKYAFSCFAEKVKILKDLQEKEKVEVTFFIKARPSSGNSADTIWYNNLQVIGIQKLDHNKDEFDEF